MKKIGVLGTGDVGNRIATRWGSLGYEVKMGSRTTNLVLLYQVIEKA